MYNEVIQLHENITGFNKLLRKILKRIQKNYINTNDILYNYNNIENIMNNINSNFETIRKKVEEKIYYLENNVYMEIFDEYINV